MLGRDPWKQLACYDRSMRLQLNCSAQDLDLVRDRVLAASVSITVLTEVQVVSWQRLLLRKPFLRITVSGKDEGPETTALRGDSRRLVQNNWIKDTNCNKMDMKSPKSTVPNPQKCPDASCTPRHMLQPECFVPPSIRVCATLILNSESKRCGCSDHLTRRGLDMSADFKAGGTGKSFNGGGGSGPLGGGGRTEWAGLDSGFLLFSSEPLLLVLGGNIGRCVGSIAEAGSGILSRSLKAKRLERLARPLGESLVSNERCCKDNGGGGDLSAMPVGGG